MSFFSLVMWGLFARFWSGLDMYIAQGISVMGMIVLGCSMVLLSISPKAELAEAAVFLSADHVKRIRKAAFERFGGAGADDA